MRGELARQGAVQFVAGGVQARDFDFDLVAGVVATADTSQTRARDMSMITLGGSEGYSKASMNSASDSSPVTE